MSLVLLKTMDFTNIRRKYLSFLKHSLSKRTCLLIEYICIITLQTMESRPVVPDRKLLARLVLIREEARNMMGGGILDERNDRGLNTLPESEVSICSEIFES